MKNEELSVERPICDLIDLINCDSDNAKDLAVATASRFHRTKKDIAEAFKTVRDLLQVPGHYHADPYHLEKVREKLGAPIAVALYRSYLRWLDRNTVIPDYLMSEVELLKYSREAELTENEYGGLRDLQLMVSRR